ncbi:MAG: hypothetical protein KDB72_02955 [Mycobacterium sp.]|nr:hypothetical protein [Mycobacterium sp.]
MAGPVQPPQPPYGPPPWPINQPPHPSGYPYPYPGAYPPPPNPRRVEYATAMLLWAVPAGVLPLFWFYSLFAMMGVDVCSNTSPCQYGFIYGAYGMGWAGAAVAAIASFLAIRNAKKRGRQALPWGLAGAVAMVGCVVGWYLLYKAGLPY